jgi:RNA polymerase sigma factor (sigma-70 family)
MDDLQSASLDACSERELVQLAQQAGPAAAAAREHLIAKHRRLMDALIRQAGVPASLRADAEQTAVVGLLEAIIRFNPTRGTRLWVFAYAFVRGAIIDTVEAIGAPRPRHGGRLADGSRIMLVSLDLLVDQEDPDAQAALDQAEDHVMLDRFLGGLTARQQHLLWLLHWQDHSQADIARRLGVSRSAVHQALDVIYQKARNALTTKDMAA